MNGSASGGQTAEQTSTEAPTAEQTNSATVQPTAVQPQHGAAAPDYSYRNQASLGQAANNAESVQNMQPQPQTVAQPAQQPISETMQQKVDYVQGKNGNNAEGATSTESTGNTENTPTPKKSNIEIFQEIFGKKPTTPEEEEAERKRMEKRKRFAAVVDGLTALSNVIATSHGALNAPNKASAPVIQDKFDKWLADNKAARERYYSQYMAAKNADDADAKNNRDFEYRQKRDKVGDEHWQRQFDYTKNKDEQQFNYRKKRDEIEDAFKKQSFDEGVRQFTVSSKQQQQRISMESRRLQKQIENDGGVTFTLGGGNGEVRVSKDRLNQQNVSYVFSKLPKEVKEAIHGKPVYKEEKTPNQYGTQTVVSKVFDHYEPPTLTAMLTAIGTNINAEGIADALREISGQKVKKGADNNDTAPWVNDNNTAPWVRK